MYHQNSSMVAPYNHLPFKVPFHFSDLTFDCTSHSSTSPPSSDLQQHYPTQSSFNPAFFDIGTLHQNLIYSRYNVPFSEIYPNCCPQSNNTHIPREQCHFSKRDYKPHQTHAHKPFSSLEIKPAKSNKRSCNINSAFSALRDCIPNVPTDTKLSKIKTLRLATSYIAYLMEVLSNDDPSSCATFDAVIVKKNHNRELRRKKEIQELMTSSQSSSSSSSSKKPPNQSIRKAYRTGWPQDVWASDLTSA